MTMKETLQSLIGKEVAIETSYAGHAITLPGSLRDAKGIRLKIVRVHEDCFEAVGRLGPNQPDQWSASPVWTYSISHVHLIVA